jgi:hypothetical protein
MLSVIMANIIMLSVIMVIAIMLNVVAPLMIAYILINKLDLFFITRMRKRNTSSGNASNLTTRPDGNTYCQRHDTQNNVIQHNDIQYTSCHHNEMQHNNK